MFNLAQNNARDISVFHAPSEFGRVDAEWYVLATGLGLRHVHSLKDAIVHAVKQTKVPGLSSSAVAGGGKPRKPHNLLLPRPDIALDASTPTAVATAPYGAADFSP